MLPCGAPCTSLILERSLLPEKVGSSGLMLIIGWRAIQKLVNQHIHIFPGKLCSAFSERPGAWFPLLPFCPVDCPGHPSSPPPTPRSPLAKQHQSGLLRTGAGFQEGRPVGDGEVQTCVRVGKPGSTVVGGGQSQPRLLATFCPFLHSPPAAHFTVFL